MLKATVSQAFSFISTLFHESIYVPLSGHQVNILSLLEISIIFQDYGLFWSLILIVKIDCRDQKNTEFDFPKSQMIGLKLPV